MHKAINNYSILFIILLVFTVGTSLASDLDENKLSELNAQAKELMQDSPDEAIKILKLVLDKTADAENEDIRAEALKLMGTTQYYKQNYRQAQEYYEQALQIYRELDDKEGIGAILNNSGLLYEIQGDQAKALKRYNEASVIFSQLENSRDKLAISISNIGNTYYTLGRFDKALDYLSQALKISEDMSDSLGMAPSYNNIGNIYLSLNEFNSAIQYYFKAEKIHKKYDDKRKLSTVYNNIGEAYLGLGKIDEAVKYNQLSLEIAKKNMDNEGVVSSLINISDIYIKNEDYDKAHVKLNEAVRLSSSSNDKFLHARVLKGFGALKIHQREYDKAVASYSEALSLVEESGSDLLIQEIYAGLSEAWHAKGNYQRAYEFLKKHQNLADSLYTRESMNRLNMIRVSFELEQTERDNQLLKQQNIYSKLALSRQQTIRNLLIIIIAIVIVSLAFLFLMYHSKKKKNELLAERNKQISNQKEELDKLYLEQFKLNETKTKFFSIVAHDLKSPFQSLLGFSELLTMEYDQFTDEQRLDAITNMYKVTSDTFKLIENLLEWGRIQTGNANVVLKYINVKDLVDSIVPIFEIPLKNKDLKLSIDLAPLQMAHADPNMMGAILRNLLSNAIKFSNPGGTISIKGTTNNEASRLSVSDTGVGISPKIIEKLFTFDPKIRRVGTKGETGTGMGLGLCMEFMQLNHGMIKVASKPGEGSTFTMIMQPGAKKVSPEPVANNYSA